MTILLSTRSRLIVRLLMAIRYGCVLLIQQAKPVNGYRLLSRLMVAIRLTIMPQRLHLTMAHIQLKQLFVTAQVMPLSHMISRSLSIRRLSQVIRLQSRLTRIMTIRRHKKVSLDMVVQRMILLHCCRDMQVAMKLVHTSSSIV